MDDNNESFKNRALRLLKKRNPNQPDIWRELDEEGEATFEDCLILDMVMSSDSRKQKLLIEMVYGLPPRQMEISGKDGGPILMKKADDLTDDELAAIAGISANSSA